jgi:hypothetical protein
MKNAAALGLSGILLCLNAGSAAAEDIAVDCQVTPKSGKSYKMRVETDGANLTSRSDAGQSASYENMKGDSKEEYVRVSLSEIRYGATYSIQGLLVKLETIIDRNTGEMSSTTTVGAETKATESGQCEKAAPTQRKF